MFRIAIILLVLVTSNLVFSQESTIYLVHLNKLVTTNLDTIKVKGITTIKAAGGQPYILTQVLLPGNTNYALVQIVPQNATETNLLSLLETRKEIEKISSHKVIVEYQNRIGGCISYMESIKYKDLPTDFNKSFSVITSTP